MSGAVEKLLFTYYLWNRYHQQIPGIKLIQIGAISILAYARIKPLFHCWKDIWCWKPPCRVATSEKDRLHIYSLWFFCAEADTWRLVVFFLCSTASLHAWPYSFFDLFLNKFVATYFYIYRKEKCRNQSSNMIWKTFNESSTTMPIWANGSFCALKTPRYVSPDVTRKAGLSPHVDWPQAVHLTNGLSVWLWHVTLSSLYCEKK